MFVITGGGSGLGRALALNLAQREQSVLVIGRREEALQETAAQHSSIAYCQADVCLPTDRAKIDEILKSKPMLQGLIHNAGIIEPMMSVTSITQEEWRACMATNLDAPLFLTQLLLPRLTQARVLHVGSGAAYFPIQGWAAYCVSKAALAMLTRCMQLELPTLALASVMPGIVDTPMQGLIRNSDQMAQDKHAYFCQLKETQHLLTPETVALFLSWLLLDAPRESYVAQEWDIYDPSHHSHWLTPPHVVPDI